MISRGMAKASPPSVTDDDIVFELERFEPSDGHLTLSGRWFGVRGRRFVRPTLTLEVSGERRRALADLADKPWAAEDGEPWQATFPWHKSGRVEESELSVAPDITISLPAPGAKRSRAQRLAAQPRRAAMTASWASLVSTIEGPVGNDTPALAEAQPALTAVAEAEPAPPPPPDPEALQNEIDTLRAALAESGGAVAEATSQLETVREELSSLRNELEAAQRRAVAQERELGAARAELAAARESREAALRTGAQAEADRDEALTRATEAEAEREALRAEQDALRAELEERRAAVQQLTRQHDEVVAARGAALVMRGATQALPAYEHQVGWARRVLAVLVLIAIVLGLLVVLGAL
jgi:hypothetical protein